MIEKYLNFSDEVEYRYFLSVNSHVLIIYSDNVVFQPEPSIIMSEAERKCNLGTSTLSEIQKKVSKIEFRIMIFYKFYDNEHEEYQTINIPYDEFFKNKPHLLI